MLNPPLTAHIIDRLVKHRRWLAEMLSLVIACAAMGGGFLLRFEFAVPPVYLPMLASALGWALGVKYTVLRLFGIPHLGWRHVGFKDLTRVAAAHTTASLILALVLRAAVGSGFPRSIYLLDLMLSLCLELVTRATIRILLGAQTFLSPDRRRVLIFGAGKAGVLLLKDLENDPGYEVAGFLDDDASKRNMRVHGVRVLGGREDIRLLSAKLSIEEIFIALPRVDGENLGNILEFCETARVPAKRVPALSEIIEGRVLLDQVREVRIEDLLGRPPAALDSMEVAGQLRGNVILVTGAGGSIGSELCRQIAKLQPALLIGFDQAETALYEIDSELRLHFPELPFAAEIGSIRNRERLDEVFEKHRPSMVFHAAAYKHVPLMETHAFEAIHNNIFGTRNVVQAAAAWGVQDFVMISSDKAVRPTNIMGATKRISELVCMAESVRHANKNTPMKTVAVRFGNVLGSNGSVIPRFRQQIARGGPVTVTHPEVQRFFMTIPEAAQLVLQAAVLGTRDAIFVLEMGRPIRILDLARRMIHLSGLRPEQDIAIEFCGLRPGEKMYEELSGYQENTGPTPHPQIRAFLGPAPDPFGLDLRLRELLDSSERSDLATAIETLQELVPDYHPSQTILHASEGTRAKSVVA